MQAAAHALIRANSDGSRRVCLSHATDWGIIALLFDATWCLLSRITGVHRCAVSIALHRLSPHSRSRRPESFIAWTTYSSILTFPSRPCVAGLLSYLSFTFMYAEHFMYVCIVWVGAKLTETLQDDVEHTSSKTTSRAVGGKYKDGQHDFFQHVVYAHVCVHSPWVCGWLSTWVSRRCGKEGLSLRSDSCRDRRSPTEPRSHKVYHIVRRRLFSRY